ncbi:MAG: hypothetical protein JNJ54_23105, partial [Myxococcaceae bacterium]|nr:hypothetical protein [Myxococcaceae bacterium]
MLHSRLHLLLVLLALPACVCVDPSKVTAFKCGDGDACREGQQCCPDGMCRASCTAGTGGGAAGGATGGGATGGGTSGGGSTGGGATGGGATGGGTSGGSGCQDNQPCMGNTGAP